MSARRRKPLSPRKLLIASVGVATMCYVGCDNMETSGNLVGPPPNTNSSSTSSAGGAAGEAGNGGQGGEGGAGGQAGGHGGAGGHAGGQGGHGGGP